jgi:hypothetical protein
MPTIEWKKARGWIDAYVKKAGKLEGVTMAVRVLVKKTLTGGEKYVNPWKIPSFDSNGPLCCFMVGKEHDVCVHARGGTAGPGEAAGGNREGRATRKTAERCRSEEAGSEEIDCRGGEVE